MYDGVLAVVVVGHDGRDTDLGNLFGFRVPVAGGERGRLRVQSEAGVWLVGVRVWDFAAGANVYGNTEENGPDPGGVPPGGQLVNGPGIPVVAVQNLTGVLPAPDPLVSALIPRDEWLTLPGPGLLVRGRRAVFFTCDTLSEEFSLAISFRTA
jgi:hypothetical protein